MDVVNDVNMLATPFPPPPGAVLHALHLLDVCRRGDADEMAAAGNLDDLPRPWDPASCPHELREAIWEWCDQVAGWLNHEYVWRPTQMIPPCWPQHPHIARELAVLAILRWNAEESLTPEPIEEWHRYTFPMFNDRLSSRLGESACRTGKHTDWPAASRYAAFIDTAADRHHAIYGDSRPVTQLHARRA